MMKFKVLFPIITILFFNNLLSQEIKLQEINISEDGETKITFGDFLKESESPLILVFFSDWCYPCRKIIDKPVISEISKMADKIYFISADNSYFNLTKNLKDKQEYEKYYKFKNSELLFEGGNLMKYFTGKTEFPFIAKINKKAEFKLIEKIGELKKEGKLIDTIKKF